MVQDLRVKWLGDSLAVCTTWVDRAFGTLLDLKNLVLSNTIFVRGNWDVTLLDGVWWSHQTDGLADAALGESRRDRRSERDSTRTAKSEARKHDG